MESFQQQRENPVKDVDEAASNEEDSNNESINMDTEEAEIESRLSTTEAIQDTIALMKEANDRKVTMSIAHAAQIKAYAQQRNNDLTPSELKKLDKERDAKNKSYSIDIKKLEDAITGHKELLANLGYQEPVTANRSSAEEMDLVRSIRETSLAVDKELDNEDKRITMKPDTTDVKHAAIASLLKQDWIPVYAGTKTVDFSRVKLMEFKDSPELTFDKLNLDKEDLPLEIVLRIINFRRDFKEFYMRHLSAVLFDDMVQYYAKGALRQAGFASHFKHELDKYDRNQRDWHAVKKCINKVLNVETLRGKIIQALFNVSPKASEHVFAFCNRVELLFEATETEDNQAQLFIEALVATLPDKFKQDVQAEFGSVTSIKSLQSLLNFLRKMECVMDGRRTDPFEYFTTLAGTRPENKRGRTQSRDKDKRSRDSRSRSGHRDGYRRSEVYRPRKDKRQRRSRSPVDKPECDHPVCKLKMSRHYPNECWESNPDLKPLRLRRREEDQKRYNDRRQDDRRVHSTRSGFGHNIGALQVSRIRSDHYENVDTMGTLTEVFNKDVVSSASHYSFVPQIPIRRANAYKEPDSGDNRIAITIIHQGEKYRGLLDTGATTTIINQDLANELGINYAILQGADVQLLKRGMITDNMITCNELRITCNGRTVEQQILVMLIDNYDFVIGMDLFARFGFRIEGVVMPKQSVDHDIWIQDEKPAIISDEQPEEEMTEEFIEQKRAFMSKLQPTLKANEIIDPKSHCDLEIMRVELKVMPKCIIQERPRPFHAQTEKDEVDKTIQKWWDTGVIVRAPKGNPYNSSLTLAARKDLDGNIIKFRVCLDPRTLNKQLEETDSFPLPLISDILMKTAGHKYFSTIDLSQAYHRLPVDPRSQPYTAFTYGFQQYMFARAPFGLKPLTSIFQRGMSHLLSDMPYVCVYVDDIVIFSNTIEEHFEHVRFVIQRLTLAKLIINMEKSRFLSTRVELLGFIIDRHGRSINPAKVANIESWAAPNSGKMVSRYLGMFGYFREYIPLYSTITAPLEKLRNKHGQFKLDRLEQESFDTIKMLIAKAPVLSFPDFKKAFYVATDASNVGIGAVLYQLPEGPENETKVNYISFMARALRDHEKNYPAYKKEFLGIIYALKKYHYYLWGRKFTLYTDHRPLTYVHEQKELPTILADWKETLLSHNFTCVYRPGILNIIPDALSRAFPSELWETSDGKGPKIAAMTRSKSTQTPGISSETLLQHFSDNRGQSQAPYIHRMVIDETERTIPDEDDRRSLLRETHSFGHLGATAMVKALHEKNITWPKVKEACVEWVSQCSACQYFNIARKGYHPMTAIHATLPGEHLAIDLAQFPVSTRGNNFVLLVVDICTRFVFLFPLKFKNATAIAGALFGLFCTIGFPMVMQSDNGTEFVNAILKEVTQKLRIQHRLTTPYHPRANGVAERHVRTLKDMICKELEGVQESWDIHLPMIQLQMNAKVGSLHQSTPFSLFYGRSFAGISDFSSAESHLLSEKDLEKRIAYLTNLVYPAIAQKSQETQQRMIELFNRTHKMVEFPPGSYVMAKEDIIEGKLDPKYKGPYLVLRRTEFGSYELQDATKTTLPRNYAPEQLKKVTQALDRASEESFEVQAILSHRDTMEGKRYLVKWKDYDASHNSEIAPEDFDSPAMMTRYHKQQRQHNPYARKQQERRDDQAQRRADKRRRR